VRLSHLQLSLAECSVSWINYSKPTFTHILFLYSDNSYFVPGPEPNMQYIPTLTILDKTSSSDTNIKFDLEISGPSHTSIFILPLNDTKLVDWSFIREPIDTNVPPPYYVYWSYALDSKPLQFSLEFEVIISLRSNTLETLINLIFFCSTMILIGQGGLLK